jgi:hypothetical protein
MKKIIFSLLIAASPWAMAASSSGTGDIIEEADYVVPVPPELEEQLKDYANFKVKVVKPYAGLATTSITYTFPEELTGHPPLTVTLTRVPGSDTEWQGVEMNASCDEYNDLLTCEIYLNKKPEAPAKVVDLNSIFSGNMVMKSSQTFINKNNVVNFLTANISNKGELKNHLDILDIFLDSEPAGVLSYRFTP